MEYLVRKVASQEAHNLSELARAEAEFPSPPTPVNTSPYYPPKQFKTPPAHSPRTRAGRAQAAATMNAEHEEDLFTPSGSQPNPQAQPIMRTPPNVDTRGGRHVVAEPESPSANLGRGNEAGVGFMQVMHVRHGSSRSCPMRGRARGTSRARGGARGRVRGSRDLLAAGMSGVTLGDSDEQADSE